MNELPEECIAKMLSYLGPQKSCELASVSRTFSSASQSDVLWESFLPADYRSIISHSSDPTLLSTPLTKKQLFRWLCHSPVLIDQGKKSWMLEKQSGKIRMMLGARDLNIVWGDTPEYWNWTSNRRCRFGEVAVLNFVWWLEIRGRIHTRMLSPGTRYAAYLVYKMKEYRYDWFFAHEAVKVGVGGHGQVPNDQRDVILGAKETRERIIRIGNGQEQIHRVVEWVPKESGWCGVKGEKGWWKVKLGEFESKEEDDDDDEVEMSAIEVEKGIAKGGLVVHGIEIVPLSICENPI